MVRRGPLRAAACASRVRLGVDGLELRYCDRCYVEGGTQCETAMPSPKHPGAATKECDVCTCTQTGISNGFGHANVGCGNHFQDGNFFCYTAVRILSFGTLFRSPPPLCVQGGSKCRDATPKDWAGYRPCDPCACTVDSRSGKVKVPFNGCANHADRGLNGNPWCYVAGGTACKSAHADPSLPGSAWKACVDQNCQWSVLPPALSNAAV